MRLEQPASSGERNRTGDESAARPKRYVHCPVFAPRLTELPSAIEGVDDPDAVAGQPLPTVDGVLNEHGIVRAQVRNEPENQEGRSLIAQLLPEARRSSG